MRCCRISAICRAGICGGTRCSRSAIRKTNAVNYSGHMINRLAELRRARGISAVDLAAQAGVTRQAIYAIEAGTYMPNTAVALRIARMLETSVEALFALDDEVDPRAGLRSFDLLDTDLPIAPGEPIQICRV